MMGTARLLAGVGGAMTLVAVEATRAAAQQEPVSRGSYPYSVEGYVAQYSLDDRVGTSKQNLGGFGLRLTYNPPELDRPTHRLTDRARGSIFAIFTPDQGSPKVNTLHIGVETDFAFLTHPAAGSLDPFLSFGLGVFRQSRENQFTTTNAGRITRSDFAFTPGVGTRVGVARGVGLRLDAAMPIVIGASTTANFSAQGGLYVSF